MIPRCSAYTRGAAWGWCYATLPPYIAKGHPVYGIQALGLGPGEQLPPTLRDMAADYRQHIRSVQREGPYHLAGWCFGGAVAHEVAVQFQDEGQEVALLAMMDSVPFNPREAETLEELSALLDERELLLEILRGLNVNLTEISEEMLDRDTASDIIRQGHSAVADLGHGVVSTLLEILQNNLWLSMNGTPLVYQGDITFFLSGSTKMDPTRWQPYISGRIDVVSVPVPHEYMLHKEGSSVIGPEISRRLTAAGQGRRYST